ncbi:MAG: hypothetical protein AVDCRST_MAG27-2116, partial [uncultured Craurococcus sp.]
AASREAMCRPATGPSALRRYVDRLWSLSIERSGDAGGLAGTPGARCGDGTLGAVPGGADAWGDAPGPTPRPAGRPRADRGAAERGRVARRGPL